MKEQIVRRGLRLSGSSQQGLSTTYTTLSYSGRLQGISLRSIIFACDEAGQALRIPGEPPIWSPARRPNVTLLNAADYHPFQHWFPA